MRLCNPDREAALPAYLLLEDGRRFEGTAMGARGPAIGEVVFNTAMTGYQEILTDPSYAGQLVAMTYPLIGNYGTNGRRYRVRSAPGVRLHGQGGGEKAQFVEGPQHA